MVSPPSRPTRLRTVLAAAVLALGLSACRPAPRPNVVLIVADDMGYSDLGSYGGEIETPNLDRLASEGVKFLRFFNAAKCEPSRASLMTGRYWQEVGIDGSGGPTLGDVMRLAGYRTFAVGKWHLAGNPVDRGFDHFFGHLSGVSDYFKGSPSHRLDHQPFVPERGDFYTTDANADYAIRFIEQSRAETPDRPFFLYLAFNAPHAPLQAWPEDIAKYRGRYRTGWDALRAERYRRQLELAVVKPEWKLPPRPDTIPAWDTLSAEEKDFEDLRMSIYAAMVDRMDRAIGRVLERLETLGQDENTLVIFLNDNGANPFDHQEDRSAPVLEAWWNLGLGWAHATGTPFRHYKRNVLQGGIATPMIVRWPGHTAQIARTTDRPGHIIDLMATLVDVSDRPWPREFSGRRLEPLEGRSLLPILDGTRDDTESAWFFQLYDHRAAIEGDWKLASDWGRPWQLFDLAEDRTELDDLAAQQPERVARMEEDWNAWARRVGGVTLDDQGGEPIYRHRADREQRYLGDEAAAATRGMGE